RRRAPLQPLRRALGQERADPEERRPQGVRAATGFLAPLSLRLARVERFELALLGPIEARSAGRSLDLGGPRERAVLAQLALRPNRAVLLSGTSEDLENSVARLRAALGAEAIVSGPAGYELRAQPDQ